MRTSHLCIRLEVFSKDAIGDGLEITMSISHLCNCLENFSKVAIGDGSEIVFLMAGKYNYVCEWMAEAIVTCVGIYLEYIQIWRNMYISNCQKLLLLWKWFYSSRLDSFVTIIRWLLSEIIRNKHGKLDFVTTESNHCEHFYCTSLIGNVQFERLGPHPVLWVRRRASHPTW